MAAQMLLLRGAGTALRGRRLRLFLLRRSNLIHAPGLIRAGLWEGLELNARQGQKKSATPKGCAKFPPKEEVLEDMRRHL